MTKTTALLYHSLHGSVTERIKHEAFNMLTYREKSSNPIRSRYLITEKSPYCRNVSKLDAIIKLLKQREKNNETNVFYFYHNICLHLPGTHFYQLKRKIERNENKKK